MTKPDTISRMSEYLGLKNLSRLYTEYIQRAHDKQLGLLDFTVCQSRPADH